jgi:hypothetical protein
VLRTRIVADAAFAIGLLALAACAATVGNSAHGVDRPTGQQVQDHERAFERLKGLEGEYVVGNPARPSATVVFRGIARGTALQEEWSWPGGARELTVFFMDNGTLRATHYCHSGVQSTMTLQEVALQETLSGGRLAFGITSATNLPSPAAAHNTAFSYAFDSGASVRRNEQWTQDGRVMSSDVELVRRPQQVDAETGR